MLMAPTTNQIPVISHGKTWFLRLKCLDQKEKYCNLLAEVTFQSKDIESSAYDSSSVIRQKGESQNGCYKKTKHDKFSEKQTFLTPFGVLWFLLTRVLRFALLPYYRRVGYWEPCQTFLAFSKYVCLSGGKKC